MRIRVRKKGATVVISEAPEKKIARDCGAVPGRNYLVAEVSDLLRISPDSVYSLIKSGDLVAAKIKRKHVITGQSVADYFERMIEIRQG